MSQHFKFKLNKKDEKDIKNILKEYEYDSNNLISILQKIQNIHGYLPRNFIFFLSNELEIPSAEIYSITTFYSQFKFNKFGKNHIICCDGTACHVKGSPKIINYLEGILKIKPGETTKDKLFSLDVVACLGCCAISPVCIINGEIYGDLNIDKVKKILNKLQKVD